MNRVFRTFFGVLLLTSCATTIGSVWRDPGFAGPPFRNVLICAQSHDETTRRLLEEAFVRELRINGVTGVPFCSALAPRQPTVQEMRDAVASSGADGVVVTRPASVKEIPSTDDRQDYTVWPGSGWGPPGGFDYSPTETEVNIQARAYTAHPKGALIWYGTSDTIDPSSLKSLISQVVPRFVSAMAQAGVLPPKDQSRSP